jgi:predicted metal-dependent hydrolase
VSGDLHRTKVKRALNGWISKQAKAYFTPEIQRLSETTGLAYETLRFQKYQDTLGKLLRKKGDQPQHSNVVPAQAPQPSSPTP